MASFKFGSHEVRSLKSFGVGGLLSEHGSVYFETLFNTQQVGRVSDLLCARFLKAQPDEAKLRLLITLAAFQSHRTQSTRDQWNMDTSKPLEDPATLEVGIDDEKVAIGISVRLPELLRTSVEGLIDRIQDLPEYHCFEELIIHLRNHADRLIIRVHQEQSRMEFVALSAIPGKIDDEEINSPDNLHLIEIDEPEETPKIEDYKELADLNYDELLKDESPTAKYGSPVSGEYLVSKTKVVDDAALHEAIKKKAKESGKEAEAYLAEITGGGEPVDDDEQSFSGDGEDVDPATRVAGGKGGKEAVTRIGGGKGAGKDFALVKGKGEKVTDDELIRIRGDGSKDGEMSSAKERLYKSQISTLQSKIQDLKDQLEGKSLKVKRLGNNEDDDDEDEEEEGKKKKGLFGRLLPWGKKDDDDDEDDEEEDDDEELDEDEEDEEEDEDEEDDEEEDEEEEEEDDDEESAKEKAKAKKKKKKKKDADDEEDGEPENDHDDLPDDLKIKDIEEEEEEEEEEEGEEGEEGKKKDEPKPEDPKSLANNLKLSMEAGSFDAMVKRLHEDGMRVQAEVKSNRAKKWIEGMLDDLMEERKKLQKLSKSMSYSVRQKELEFRNKEKMLNDQLKKKDEELMKKEKQIIRTKDQLNRVSGDVKRMKDNSQGAAQTESLNKKLSHTQNMLKVAKDENGALKKKVDELKQYILKVKKQNQAPAAGGAGDDAAKKLDEAKKKEQRLMERVSTSDKKVEAANQKATALKAKLDSELKQAVARKKELAELQMKITKAEAEEKRLNARVSELEAELGKKKAS